jgi:hypothetical protein
VEAGWFVESTLGPELYSGLTWILTTQERNMSDEKKLKAPIGNKAAISKYYRLPDQSLQDIMAEVNTLTAEDMKELGPLCAAALGHATKE